MAESAGIRTGVGAALPQDSAIRQVTGEAVYVSDIVEPAGVLHLQVGYSSVAHGRIVSVDLSAVREYPGVIAVFTAADIPGENDVAPVIAGDPVFADSEVSYAGQSIFAVAAESLDCARKAALLAQVEIESLPVISDVATALERDSHVLDSKTLDRGDVDAALSQATHQLEGSLTIGGQDHFYLEGQAALAIPGEEDEMRIFSSTQHPTEVQHCCARVLGVADHCITVETRRLGGGFGGKESQPALFAAIAAVAARKTGRAAKLVLDRDDDMIMTGKRHDFETQYVVGFDAQGRIQGIDMTLASRCGMSVDLSGAINDRAMFHADNAYFLENVRITSHRCKTHTVSNTAFRGFGGPQGMMVIERVMEDIARHLSIDPLVVRQRNFYGHEQRNVTPYGMTVEDNVIDKITTRLIETSNYLSRREKIREFNDHHRVLKKGLALTPVKFGISFTATHLNQAGALLHLYSDGSLMLNHGGVEMGQGIYIKVAQVVAEVFQVEVNRVKITATTTDKVPNTSPTAASSGSDLNGKAAQAAALKIRQRLIDYAARQYAVSVDEIFFRADGVKIGAELVPFNTLVKQAYMARVGLSATGFYRTPKIDFNPQTLSGRPFYYFAYGAAVSEVTIDTLTGEYQLDQLDILHDCGRSLNPAMDRGQIEGGFIQGMGWLTTEELVFDAQGQLQTHAPSTYKIPACGDRPARISIEMLHDNDNAEDTIYRSKAVGEPPLMLGISVFHAISDAVSSLAGESARPVINAPATPEEVLRACDLARQATGKKDD